MEPEDQRSGNVKCYMLIHLWTYCRSNSAVGPHCLKQNITLPNVGAARLRSPSGCSNLDANASLGSFNFPNYKQTKKRKNLHHYVVEQSVHISIYQSSS